MPDTQNEIAIVTAETIQDKIYVVRGQQVMLDFELAELYGYTTKRFNEQVRNNAAKFAEDFRFQLTVDEWEILRSKKSTSSWGGRRYLPYAFTEQGIYMLMTVLRGELATQQSIALIRLFKQMKEFIATSQELPAWQAVGMLSLQTAENETAIKELKAGLADTQETLTEFMAGFAEGGTFHDRFIVIDHGTPAERVFACGASSKDAGRRTTVIMESTLPGLYRDMVDGLLGNPELTLR